MNLYRAVLDLRTDFGTPLSGDTLFGQLCWAVRERFGVGYLEQRLDGYTSGRPFAVVSDCFPQGLLPRPSIPDVVLGREVDPSKRKEARRLVWLPASGAGKPLEEWLSDSVAGEAVEGQRPSGKQQVVTQNTINRLTGTTGTGMFAPRQVARIAYPAGTKLDFYAVLDGDRLARDAFGQLLADVGATGYGRDASTGLGKFEVATIDPWEWPVKETRCFMTLAPCAPDPGTLEASACFYLPLTRFGRHGNVAAIAGIPYKRPVLLLATGAVLTTRERESALVLGAGLGGAFRPVSASIPGTVVQGYAPVAPLDVELRP